MKIIGRYFVCFRVENSKSLTKSFEKSLNNHEKFIRKRRSWKKFALKATQSETAKPKVSE